MERPRAGILLHEPPGADLLLLEPRAPLLRQPLRKSHRRLLTTPQIFTRFQFPGHQVARGGGFLQHALGHLHQLLHVGPRRVVQRAQLVVERIRLNPEIVLHRSMAVENHGQIVVHHVCASVGEDLDQGDGSVAVTKPVHDSPPGRLSGIVAHGLLPRPKRQDKQVAVRPRPGAHSPRHPRAVAGRRRELHDRLVDGYTRGVVAHHATVHQLVVPIRPRLRIRRREVHRRQVRRRRGRPPANLLITGVFIYWQFFVILAKLFAGVQNQNLHLS